jgi:rhamnosyltransferase
MIRKFHAIIVTYQQNQVILNELIENLLKSGFEITLINNGTKKISAKNSRLTVKKNDVNIGLSKALNQGIKIALLTKPRGIALFDQDSSISVESLCKLKIEATHLFSKEKNVIAVGPSFFEKNSNVLHGFARLEFLKISFKRTLQNYNEALFLITSGCVLNPTYLSIVGLMNENLFIDYIDTEWGLRARSLGFRLIGLNEVKMNHTVGYKYISIFSKRIPIHSNIRLYYQTRNSIYMYKLKTVPLQWKLADFIYFIKRSTLYSLIDFRNIKTVIKGIIDGLVLK